jgi:hypothetical protein
MLHAVESHQSQKVREDSWTIPVAGAGNTLHHLPEAGFVEQAIDQAKAE